MPSSVTISLPDDMKDFIEERTKAGSFSSTGEFIRELVRADQRQAERERLEKMLQEGLDSGEPIRADDAYWQALRKGVEERASARHLSGGTAR